MVDSIGGSVRVNNFLSSLNISEIQNNSLKLMEGRAGDIIDTIATKPPVLQLMRLLKQKWSKLSFSIIFLIYLVYQTFWG